MDLLAGGAHISLVLLAYGTSHPFGVEGCVSNIDPCPSASRASILYTSWTKFSQVFKAQCDMARYIV